jgi:glucokinase
MAAPTLVLDIGGTKIAAGLVDAKGQLLQRNQQPTPRPQALPVPEGADAIELLTDQVAGRIDGCRTTY